MPKRRRLQLSDELLDYLAMFTEEPDIVLSEVCQQVMAMDEDEAELEYGWEKESILKELESLIDRYGEEAEIGDFLL